MQFVSAESEHIFINMVCVQAVALLKVNEPIDESPVNSEIVVKPLLASTGYPLTAHVEY